MDKIEKLWAIEEIKQLKARYFRCMDTKDWDGLSKIFAEDAIFDARTANSVSGEGDSGRAASSNDWLYEGGKVIVDFIRGAVSELVTVHHGHCHEIEIHSPTEASGIIAMEDLIWTKETMSGDTMMHGYGHYVEEYRNVNGEWRIFRSKLTRLNVLLGDE